MDEPFAPPLVCVEPQEASRRAVAELAPSSSRRRRDRWRSDSTWISNGSDMTVSSFFSWQEHGLRDSGQRRPVIHAGTLQSLRCHENVDRADQYQIHGQYARDAVLRQQPADLKQ